MPPEKRRPRRKAKHLCQCQDEFGRCWATHHPDIDICACHCHLKEPPRYPSTVIGIRAEVMIVGHYSKDLVLCQIADPILASIYRNEFNAFMQHSLRAKLGSRRKTTRKRKRV